MKRKIIIVFSGPSGAGKSTLICYLLEKFNSAGLTVSHTTRSPRNGEIDGIDYHFVSTAKFADMTHNGEFIEYVKCYGNFYGTSKSSINDVLKNKDICVLDLEYEGAYKLLFDGVASHKCIGILVLPPALKTLRQRLQDRKTETAGSLNMRVNEAFNVKKIAKYDYVIINNELEKSKQTLLNIVIKLLG